MKNNKITGDTYMNLHKTTPVPYYILLIVAIIILFSCFSLANRKRALNHWEAAENISFSVANKNTVVNFDGISSDRFLPLIEEMKNKGFDHLQNSEMPHPDIHCAVNAKSHLHMGQSSTEIKCLSTANGIAAEASRSINNSELPSKKYADMVVKETLLLLEEVYSKIIPTK